MNVPVKTTIFVLALFCSAQLAHAANVSKTVSASQHDAEEHLNKNLAQGGFSSQSELQGEMEELTSSDLETSEQGGGLDWQAIGAQWDGLGIPQGAVITSAMLTFTLDKTHPNTGSTAFRLYAEDIDNSADFDDGITIPPSANFNITSRTRTGASVVWDASAVPVGAINDEVDISVTALVQEVVDRGGWSANNQLSLLLFPQVYLDNLGGANLQVRVFEFESFDGEPGSAPKLTVDFVPEPTSMALMGIGGLLLLRRRRRGGRAGV